MSGCGCCGPILYMGQGAGSPGETAPCVQPDAGLDVDGNGCLGVVTDPAGPVRTGPDGVTVCVSTEADNTLTTDATGCLYVPDGGTTPPTPPVFGQEELASPGWLLAFEPAGTWADTGLCVNLPEAGTYRLDGAIVQSLRSSDPTDLSTRLFDQTGGAVVPMSYRRVHTEGAIGIIETAPVGVFHTVPGPSTICLQAFHNTPATATSSGGVLTTPDIGSTMIRYEKIQGT